MFSTTMDPSRVQDIVSLLLDECSVVLYDELCRIHNLVRIPEGGPVIFTDDQNRLLEQICDLKPREDADGLTWKLFSSGSVTRRFIAATIQHVCTKCFHSFTPFMRSLHGIFSMPTI